MHNKPDKVRRSSKGGYHSTLDAMHYCPVYYDQIISSRVLSVDNSADNKALKQNKSLNNGLSTLEKAIVLGCHIPMSGVFMTNKNPHIEGFAQTIADLQDADQDVMPICGLEWR